MARQPVDRKEKLGELTFIGVPGEKVEDNAFGGAKTLESADLWFRDSKIKEIGMGAFANCVSLSVVRSDVDNMKIGSYAFLNCRSLHKAKFLNAQFVNDLYVDDAHFNVEEIEEGAFQGCRSLEVVSGRIEEIGESAFRDCSALKKCEVDGLKKIGKFAFYGCGSLCSVTLPIEVGSYAFCECTSLTKVVVPKGLDMIDVGTFSRCTALESVDIRFVKFIRENAFRDCALLKSVQTSAKSIDRNAFEDCLALKSVKLTSPKQTFIGMHTFDGCSALEKVVVQSGQVYIRDHAFMGCSSLMSVVIESDYVEIDANAFEDCTSLKEVTVPGNSKIPPTAFQG